MILKHIRCWKTQLMGNSLNLDLLGEEKNCLYTMGLLYVSALNMLLYTDLKGSHMVEHVGSVKGKMCDLQTQTSKL